MCLPNDASPELALVGGRGGLGWGRGCGGWPWCPVASAWLAWDVLRSARRERERERDHIQCFSCHRLSHFVLVLQSPHSRPRTLNRLDMSHAAGHRLQHVQPVGQRVSSVHAHVACPSPCLSSLGLTACTDDICRVVNICPKVGSQLGHSWSVITSSTENGVVEGRDCFAHP